MLNKILLNYLVTILIRSTEGNYRAKSKHVNGSPAHCLTLSGLNRPSLHYGSCCL